MREVTDQRTVRSPWLGRPYARIDGRSRPVRTFVRPWDFAVSCVLATIAITVHLDPSSPFGFGWPLLIWVPFWGYLMNRRRRSQVAVCGIEGHVPFQPWDDSTAVFCAKCDQRLRVTPDPQYVSGEVARAVADVNAARREPPQARWSDRR